MRIIDFKESKCMHCYKCVRYCDVKRSYDQRRKGRGHRGQVRSLRPLPSCLSAVGQDDGQRSRYGEILYQAGAPGSGVTGPGLYGLLQEGLIGQIHEAFRKLGFFDVRETAEGAAAVTAEYAKLLEDGKMENIITTCCPSVNDLIEIYYPRLVPTWRRSYPLWWLMGGCSRRNTGKM